MAHADFIYIRKSKRVTNIYAIGVFQHTVHFAAHVARGFLHAVKQTVNLFFEQSMSSLKPFECILICFLFPVKSNR